jgi:3-isopropylmalate dehydrogenase
MTSSSYSIAVLPGDGVGPEVIAEAVRVLRAVASVYAFELKIEEGLIGQAALDATGKMLPPETLRLCKESQATLLGPVGGSRWEHPTNVHHPKQAVYTLRGWLGTFATLRPVRIYPALAPQSPLRAECCIVDMLVVHDHSSGLIYGRPRGIEDVDGRRVATNTLTYTDGEVRRVAECAFIAARQRRNAVVSVDESKSLESGELWRDVVEAVAADYPDVAFRREDAENFMFNLVTRPGQYDVVVAAYELGRLIASTAAGLTGTYALHPAAYLGHNGQGMFQPSHGAGPDIAGQGVADPIAAIRAAGLLLEHGLSIPEAADLVEAAVEHVLGQGLLPIEVEMGNPRPSKTAELGEAIEAAVLQLGPIFRPPSKRKPWAVAMAARKTQA